MTPVKTTKTARVVPEKERAQIEKDFRAVLVSVRPRAARQLRRPLGRSIAEPGRKRKKKKVSGCGVC